MTDSQWVYYCRRESFLGFSWSNCGWHLIFFINGRWWY